MTFDAEKFGRAVGEQIKAAVEPLRNELEHLKIENSLLKEKLAALPDFNQAIRDALSALPVPKDGEKGEKGADGHSITLEDIQPLIDKAVSAIPVPKDGKDGKDGEKGIDGKDGEKGLDGIGQAGAMIDRDGCLIITTTNGETKNLGVVVGKDGESGKDGMSLDSFDLEYIEETHEICVKAACSGRVKELRYPAGGIRPGGYWREGTKAKACEAWVHDGSTYFAKRDTSTKPSTSSDDWILSARKGRDGDNGPVKLKP